MFMAVVFLTIPLPPTKTTIICAPKSGNLLPLGNHTRLAIACPNTVSPTHL
jgi:hypothetical protein